MDVRKLLKLFNGNELHQAGSPLGAGMVALEIDQMIARGMGRHMTVGALSTGIVGGGAGTVLDLDQPELAIGVPAGYCIRPLLISAQVQVGLVAADNDESEILFAVDSLGGIDGPLSAETCTIENPSNMRTDLAKGSACKCASAFTADMVTTPQYAAAADPVLDMEIARAVETFDIFSTGVGTHIKRLDLLYHPNFPPFLVGPCTLLGYWGGTVATLGGFAQVSWVEGRTQDFFVRV